MPVSIVSVQVKFVILKLQQEEDAYCLDVLIKSQEAIRDRSSAEQCASPE